MPKLVQKGSIYNLRRARTDLLHNQVTLVVDVVMKSLMFAVRLGIEGPKLLQQKVNSNLALALSS